MVLKIKKRSGAYYYFIPVYVEDAHVLGVEILV